MADKIQKVLRLIHPLSIGSIVTDRFVLKNINFSDGAIFQFVDKLEKQTIDVGIVFTGTKIPNYIFTTGLLEIVVLNKINITKQIQVFLFKFAKLLDRNSADSPYDTLRELSGKVNHPKDKCLSRLAAVELILVAKNIKSAQRHEIFPRDIDTVKELFETNNVSFLCTTRSVAYSKGLTSKSINIDADTLKTTFYSSKSPKTADRLNTLEKNVRSKSKNKQRNITNTEIGEILGYPPCCISKFLKYETMPTPQIYFKIFEDTSGPASHLLNVIDNHVKIVSHIPCTFDCIPSYKYAETVIAALKCTSSDFLKGAYIYFINGCFIKLSLDRKPGSAIRSYTVINVSNGEFDSDFNEKKEFCKLLEAIQRGNKLALDSELKIYTDTDLLYSANGQNRDWIFIEFK